jgi:hypothetical protein
MAEATMQKKMVQVLVILMIGAEMMKLTKLIVCEVYKK